MTTHPIQIRDATPEDAPFLAKCIMAGMHFYDFETEIPEDRRMFERLVESESSAGWLDSYENFRVAEVNGVPVGALQSLPGDDYRELRRKTFAALWPESVQMEAESDQEADPGEYFIDTLAVLPAYRRQGIGSALIRDAISQGMARGYQKISVTVDNDMPELLRYYADFGFEPADHRRTFGVDFLRMVYSCAN